jgi:SEC-C motif-containing protein
MDKCPCCSGKTYALCCEPYIAGRVPAPTAEALMRARYSAYARHEIDFIEKTHSIEKRDELSVEETRRWAEESEWLGLKILGTVKGREADTEGAVEFIASYSQKGMKHEHHENALFEKKDGNWFFKDGSVKEQTIVRTGAKTGRNEPCSCGSGKKYKHCCGK